MPDSISLDGCSFPTTERTRVRRHSERAHYDRDTVHAILDAALTCKVTRRAVACDHQALIGRQTLRHA